MLEKIIGYVITAALTILVSVVFINIQAKASAKKDYREWVYNRHKYLRSLANEFKSKCWDVTEGYFEKHSRLICSYTRFTATAHERDRLSTILSMHSSAIADLMNEYKDGFAAKYAEKNPGFSSDELPSFLVEEYMENISDIAFEFSKIHSLMSDQSYKLRIDDEE